MCMLICIRNLLISNSVLLRILLSGYIVYSIYKDNHVYEHTMISSWLEMRK